MTVGRAPNSMCACKCPSFGPPTTGTSHLQAKLLFNGWTKCHIGTDRTQPGNRTPPFCLCKSVCHGSLMWQNTSILFTMGNSERFLLLCMHFLPQVNNQQVVSFEASCTQQPACIMIHLFQLFVLSSVLWGIFCCMSNFLSFQALPGQRCWACSSFRWSKISNFVNKCLSINWVFLTNFM